MHRLISHRRRLRRPRKKAGSSMYKKQRNAFHSIVSPVQKFRQAQFVTNGKQRLGAVKPS